jgi:hypothetical protein
MPSANARTMRAAISRPASAVALAGSNQRAIAPDEVDSGWGVLDMLGTAAREGTRECASVRAPTRAAQLLRSTC